MDSGSTGWSNTARSRWALARPEAEDGAQIDTNARILSRRKANYAARDDQIRLLWRDGVLVPLNAHRDRFSAQAEAIDTEALFLVLLDRCRAAGMRLSESRSSTPWAPKIMAQRPDAQGRSTADFNRAMTALFTAGKIKVAEELGRDRHVRRGLARVEEEVAA